MKAPTLSFKHHLKLPGELLSHYPEALLKLHRHYGDTFQFKLPYRAHVFIHPDHVRHILRDNANNYKKSWMYDALKPILGEGLVSSEGEKWREQRKRVAPEFHGKSIEYFAEGMIKRTQKFCERWEDDQVRDVSEDMMALTLEIVGDTLFGSDFENESELIAKNLYVLLNHSLKKIVRIIPLPDSPEAKKAESEMNEQVLRIIRKKAQMNSGERPDVLSRLLASKMDERLLLDEVKTLILAGHETTSLVLSWAWYLLAKNPEKEKKLHHELDQVLQGRLPTFSDLNKLPYTRMVLQESMRIFPPIPAFSKTALKDDQIGDYSIKAGTTVQIVPYVTQRHPEFWKNPEEFIPERFAENFEAFAFLPFSHGPRACIGENFAMVEAQLILALLASRFSLKMVNEESVESEAINTLRPKNGLKMKIKVRSKTVI